LNITKFTLVDVANYYWTYFFLEWQIYLQHLYIMLANKFTSPIVLKRYYFSRALSQSNINLHQQTILNLHIFALVENVYHL